MRPTCLAHGVSPLTGSLMEKLRGSFSGILFCVQTVPFSLKKTKHNEPHVGERILQLLLSETEDDLKLQPLSSLIFCLSNAWHLDETV